MPDQAHTNRRLRPALVFSWWRDMRGSGALGQTPGCCIAGQDEDCVGRAARGGGVAVAVQNAFTAECSIPELRRATLHKVDGQHSGAQVARRMAATGWGCQEGR